MRWLLHLSVSLSVFSRKSLNLEYHNANLVLSFSLSFSLFPTFQQRSMVVYSVSLSSQKSSLHSSICFETAVAFGHIIIYPYTWNPFFTVNFDLLAIFPICSLRTSNLSPFSGVFSPFLANFKFYPVLTPSNPHYSRVHYRYCHAALY